jgi:hypothetical protein
VVVDGRRGRLDDALDRALDGGVGAELVLVRPGELMLRGNGRPPVRVHDADRVLTRWLRKGAASGVQIRPDRIVREAVPCRRTAALRGQGSED